MVVEKFSSKKAILCYITLIVGIVSMLVVTLHFPCDPYEGIKWNSANNALEFPDNFDQSTCYMKCVKYEEYFSLYVARHSASIDNFMYALDFLPKESEIYIEFQESLQNTTTSNQTNDGEKLKYLKELAKNKEKDLEKTPNPFCIFKYLGMNRLSVPPSVRPNVTNEEFQEVRTRDSVGRYGHQGHIYIYSIGLIGVALFLLTWFMYVTFIPKKLAMFFFFTVSGCLFAGWMFGVTGALDKLNCHFYGGNKGTDFNITGTKFRSYCGGEYNVLDLKTGYKLEETYQTPGNPILIWWYYYLSVSLDFIGLVFFALAPGLK